MRLPLNAEENTVVTSKTAFRWIVPCGFFEARAKFGTASALLPPKYLFSGGFVPQEQSTHWRAAEDWCNPAASWATWGGEWFNSGSGAGTVRIGGQYLPRRALILMGSESLLIMLALLASTLFHFPSLGQAFHYLWQSPNLFRYGMVVLVCLSAQWYGDLYDFQCLGSRGKHLTGAIRATGAGMLALAVLYYLIPYLRLEPGIAVMAVLFALLLILAWRFTLSTEANGSLPLESVLILGTGVPGVRLAEEIMRRPELRYKVVGFLGLGGEEFGKPLAAPGIIGGIGQLAQIVARDRVDRLVISLAERRGVMPIRELTALKVRGLPIEDAHSVFERITGRIMLDRLSPSWLILSDGFRKSRFLIATKRAIDIVVSAILLLLTAPILLLTTIAIAIETGRPILFRQERIGLGGRPFRILKFRSMRQGSEKAAPSWTSDSDPRITRAGNIIRKYRIDELPQLFNVLRGEMSLIGPRPEVPYFCSMLEREIPFFNERHSVRPGISGWAQVKFKYGASLEEAKKKFEFDLFYIKHLSVALDVTIILETIKVVLLRKGAQ